MTPRVLMVGSAPEERGGIGTVTTLLLRHGSRHADIRMVVTHREGPASMRLRLWLRGTAQALMAFRRVDVVHAHVSERGSVIRKGLLVLLAKAFRVPVVLHCHGAEFADWFSGLPGLARRGIAWTFRQADLVVVLGSSWRTRYMKLLGIPGDRVVAFGNPIELPASVAKPAGLKVVFLGRFGERKGSAAVLKAVAGLPVELVMAGDGEVVETRALARQLGVSAEIRDWLSFEERDELLASAHVFVLPSRDEGLPMALLEAMAHGLVPVVSPVGSIGDVVQDGENGLLVPPGDEAAIRRALQSLLADEGMRERLAKAARSTVEPFAIESYMDEMAARWRSLTG